MSTSRPIGVFDSGISGLTVVRALTHHLPHENIIYFGNTARVPYGPKSSQVVREYAAQDTDVLVEHNVKMIVIACNTVSAVALDVVQKRAKVPVVGVIIPGAQAAAQASTKKRIGIIGTMGTVASNAYPNALRQLDPGIQSFSQACPLFVPALVRGAPKHACEPTIPTAETAPAPPHRLPSASLPAPALPRLIDSNTRQAIRDYQSNSGLTVNGEVSENLLARLRSSQGTGQDSGANLVLAIQTRLNDLGYNAGPEDGVYGPTTRAAVRTFQNDKGLPVTGAASDSLLKSIQQALGETDSNDAQRLALVRAVETALDVRGYEVGSIDGKVTAETTSAVRTYQSDAGLAVDGRIDGNLLAKLERGQSNLDTMTRTQLVQSIQSSLNQLGYNVGPADGV